MRAERACPEASKFESFIPLVPLVFELELFKPKIGISFFGSETRIARLIAPKICTKNDSYVPQLRCKFQVSTFSRFKVIALFIFVYEFVKFAGKNIWTSEQSVAEVPKSDSFYKYLKSRYFSLRLFSQMSEFVNIFSLLQKLIMVIYINARIILKCTVECRLFKMPIIRALPRIVI